MVIICYWEAEAQKLDVLKFTIGLIPESHSMACEPQTLLPEKFARKFPASLCALQKNEGEKPEFDLFTNLIVHAILI